MSGYERHGLSANLYVGDTTGNKINYCWFCCEAQVVSECVEQGLKNDRELCSDAYRTLFPQKAMDWIGLERDAWLVSLDSGVDAYIHNTSLQTKKSHSCIYFPFLLFFSLGEHAIRQK